MMDFSSWQGILTTLIGLTLITVIGVGIRLVIMMRVQEKRQRANRQINERVKTLMAAYKTLGGSFTGDLSVDPTHVRDLRRRAAEAAREGGDAGDDAADADVPLDLSAEALGGSDRARRIRDAVESALSDILLLGTEEQVRLAGEAIAELVAGRRVHTHALVVSLRDFIRASLDLAPIPASIADNLPAQGPTRPSGGGGGSGRGRDGQGGGRGQGGGGAGGGGMGGGMMVGGGLAAGAGRDGD
ncbi:hypothetical protein GRI69_00320 [Erythrobacter vulgaris]|uniref:Uncharacterized protein n=1 Tax=Qipengyuania vulgaris TaxID=291985 RepID=A0A844XN47_9SPHN|nr:hypothetical protein [Qipengyuania vulgaris]MXO46709.1 hypothetical protein [Qipengyuania vulgaris]